MKTSRRSSPLLLYDFVDSFLIISVHVVIFFASLVQNLHGEISTQDLKKRSL